MAIRYVYEIRGREGSLDNQWQREYRRLFVVASDVPDESLLAVRDAAGIPRLYWPYAYGDVVDAGALVNKITPKQDGENPFMWEVAVDYSTTATPEQGDNPLNAPPKIKWDFRERSVPFEFDAEDGSWVCNTAGQPFDPPPETEAYDLVLTIAKNVPTYSPLLVKSYCGCTNLESWFGFPVETVKFKGMPGESENTGQYSYWRVLATLEIREEGWRRAFVNRGTMELLSANDLSTRTAILDKRGQPVSEPRLLTEGGVEQNSGNPHLVRKRDRKRKPFAILNLP